MDEVLDLIEKTVSAPVLQAVVHESHDQGFVDRSGHTQRFWRLPDNALLQFDPGVELMFAVDPVDPPVVSAEALYIAQERKAQAKAPVLLIVSRTNQPVRDLGVLVRQLRLLAVVVLTDEQRIASQPNIDAAPLHNLSGHLSTTRWPYSFPSMTSWRISALIRSSACIFFRR